MQPLDLTKAPPRMPRAPLADLNLIMAARTVDKLRAMLPGGNVGGYKIPGFSSRLMELLGITQEEFLAQVASAHSDADVAAWLRTRCTPIQIAEANGALPARCVRDRINDEAFVSSYPHARLLPLDLPLIDFLPIDDTIAFADG